mgnify:FL=1
MAIAAFVAVVGIGVAADAYEDAEDAQYEANQNAKASAAEGRKIRSEQKAENDASAANERRKQVREERIRRARIQQASQNTGTAGSSGEIGAVGGLSTTLSDNIGSNLGSLQRANNISIFAQNAADFDLKRQSAMMDLDKANQMMGIGMSIATNASGIAGGIKAGYNAIKG